MNYVALNYHHSVAVIFNWTDGKTKSNLALNAIHIALFVVLELDLLFWSIFLIIIFSLIYSRSRKYSKHFILRSFVFHVISENFITFRRISLLSLSSVLDPSFSSTWTFSSSSPLSSSLSSILSISTTSSPSESSSSNSAGLFSLFSSSFSSSPLLKGWNADSLNPGLKTDPDIVIEQVQF